MNRAHLFFQKLCVRLAWRRLAQVLALLAALALLAGAWLAWTGGVQALARPSAGQPVYAPLLFNHRRASPPPDVVEFVLLGWNDLGMHCYDLDYSDMAVLPPYNTLWAQVIRRGDPPELVTAGITVSYSFQDNTRSDNKTNFWEFDQDLFGVDLAPNVGLAGKGLAGEMDLAGGDHFEAVGIPITEFRDSAPTTPDYFQLADLVVKETASGDVLDTTTIVAPVSSEMRCVDCHSRPTASTRQNILRLHDEEEGTHLMTQRPVLCADCHADPALGLPGTPEVPSLSEAMHHQHAEEGAGAGDCYACHPGPQTRCLRDVMSQTPSSIWCTDCHGHLADMGRPGRTPWMDEPRCGNCHEPRFVENAGKLYRFSTGHGGLYCESCHNSTHAILPSREEKDNLQSAATQGFAGTIQECIVCHLTRPGEGGPHP
jgi:hypothetical protein